MQLHRYLKCYIDNTVNSFYFIGTTFRGLMMMDMFVDIWIFVEFQINILLGSEIRGLSYPSKTQNEMSNE